ncbi:hypothetical protein D3C72_1143160 [compost metagenome]
MRLVARSIDSTRMAAFQPSSGAPRRALSGTITSSKKTSANDSLPSIDLIGTTRMPGVSIGTANISSPRCLSATVPVRVSSRQ